MELVAMRPEEIRRAALEQWPVLLPVGSVEYHGEHMPVGTDAIIAEGICRCIAQRADVVLAPTLPLTPTMNWAGGVRDGDIDFPAEAFEAYARAFIVKLVDMGFTDLFAMVGHAGEGGLPATVLKKIGCELTAKLTGPLGSGWSRVPPADWPTQDVFGILNVIIYEGMLDYPALGRCGPMPVGHGGCGETQLVMALSGETVRMAALDSADKPLPFWLDDVGKATLEEGVFWLQASVDSWVAFFNKRKEGKKG